MSSNFERVKAMARANEIKRKTEAQKAQASGYVPSQLGHLLKLNKLVQGGHFNCTGKIGKDNFEREQKNKAQRERNAKYRDITHVKKDASGKIVEITNKRVEK